MSQYPDPNETGWEDKYVLSYAKDSVYTKLYTTLKMWADEKRDLLEKRKENEKDILTA